jgi:hypothetical protein
MGYPILAVNGQVALKTIFLSRQIQAKTKFLDEPFKSSKIPKILSRNAVNTKNMALRSLQVFYTFVLRVEIATIFEPKMVAISARNTVI